MGKNKRRQGDPEGDKVPSEASSSEDNKPGTSLCPHAKKIKRLQKGCKGNFALTCDECNDANNKAEKSSPTESNPQDDGSTTEVDLLMCLSCGKFRCGEKGKNHALAHQKAPRSDSHDIAYDLQKKIIWCLVCQVEVRSASLDAILKTWQKKIERPSKPEASKSEFKNPNQATPFLTKELCVTNKNQPVVKGLQNLGNTCFYNSVLQCLAQTPYLIPVLERLTVDGESFVIPERDELEALPGILSQVQDSTKTDLTNPLLNLLKTMKNREVRVVRPNDLLQCLQKRYDQFKGREQHDAHELLRHLLEGVRSDDLKRYQQVILKKHGCFGVKNAKTAKSSAPETIQLVRKYGFMANDLPLGPDILFRGQLISILECQECRNTSTRTENFLDLSLPVTEEKPLPPTRKKDNMDYGTGPSKQQLKKEKREKKKAKKHARQASRNEKTPVTQSEVLTNSNDESDQSDADVEDNVEPDSTLENKNDVVESGYSSEKAQNADSAESRSPAESGCAEGELSLSMEVEPDDTILQASNPALEALFDSAFKEADPPQAFTIDDEETNNKGCVEDLLQPFADASKESDKVNLDFTPLPNIPQINEIPPSPTSPLQPTPPSKDSDEDMFDIAFHSPTRDSEPVCSSVNNCADSDPANEMPKCSPTEGGEGDATTHPPINLSDLEKKLRSLPLTENGAEGSCHSDKSDCKDVGKDSHPISTVWRTVGPKIPIKEGDCSVISCLNQFTAPEIMNGSNKVGCEYCTKKRGKDGRTVYTTSTKQLLISAPPAILILHLKRFIADISRLKKMNRHVSFPMSLDLAPFCSVQCRDLPSMQPDQTEIRYSLYGVVEHTGQMGGGHYVAYVKVRPDLGDQDPRWKFLAPDRPFLQERPTGQESAESPSGTSNTFEEKWFNISDSQVYAVDEEKVKRSQAYLLFYERVF